MDKDGLGVSVAPNPAQPSLEVFFTIKPVFVLTCQWPVPLHPVASKGMVYQAFHVSRHVGLFAEPAPPPNCSMLSGASRNSGCTPHCCVIPHAPFSKRPPTPQLAGPRRIKPNKLMSQTTSTLATYCTAQHSAVDPNVLDTLLLCEKISYGLFPDYVSISEK